MIYEANYNNGQKTIVHDFNEIVAFVRDTKVGASVNVWQNGNFIMHIDVEPRQD
jgi:hypothetical protein